MTPQQVETLQALIHSHPKHAPYTALERISQLERMMSFYVSKTEIAPHKQAMIFNGFISALEYAINTIKLYDQVANGLVDLGLEVKK